MEKNSLRPQQQLPPKAEFKNKINKQNWHIIFSWRMGLIIHFFFSKTEWFSTTIKIQASSFALPC